MKIVEPSVELLFITPNAAQLIEQAGRTCYKSADKITADSAEEFVRMILERGHESVIEHAYASFRVTCDRGEWRHFLKLRTSVKAHPQMRTIANQVGARLHVQCPAVFNEAF